MCGISGYIGKYPISSDKIEKTLSLMKNRGPDGQSFKEFQFGDIYCYLLHSRLSIIDLNERANQPFTIREYTIIYNGEIYNYIEVKKLLESRGVKFFTSSDTEVLLQAYIMFGKESLSYLEGMWAFAIYNSKDGSLFFSRDRFAEKPFYYHQNDSGFFWGSEIKFISSLSGTKFNKNYNHLRRYLGLGYKSLYKVEDTFFEDVKELKYAEQAEINSKLELKKSRYWTPNVSINEGLSLQDSIERSKEYLLESLKIRLRSDVPLAFCLSGGVDSATIVSIAAKIFNYKTHTFSIIDSDERYNELENIQATIQDTGSKHTIIYLSHEGNLKRLENLVKYHDSPIATASYLIHSMISEEEHKNGYKVTFSGTSADEIFTGYYDHFLLHLYEMRYESNYSEYLKNWHDYTGKFIRNKFLKNPDLYLENPEFREHVFDNYEEFNYFLDKPFESPFTEFKFNSSLLRNRMLNELFHEATPVILHEDDLNSMYYSLENRSPFLDTRLFEFGYSIPAKHLIQDGYGKYVLREAMKGILNDKVRLDRKKKGFNASINSLFDLKSNMIKERILDPSLEIYKILDYQKVKPLFDMEEAQNQYSKFIFNIMNTVIFLEKN